MLTIIRKTAICPLEGGNNRRVARKRMPKEREMAVELSISADRRIQPRNRKSSSINSLSEGLEATRQTRHLINGS